MANDKLTLKVAEARPRDVGRGIARVDPADLEKLGCEIGDVVRIEGKRQTAAKIMPAYREDRDKGIVQIDGIIRENAQVGLDEKASVEKTTSRGAEKITLSPITISGLRGERDTRYIGRLLEGLPLLAGDRVRANLFGTRSCDFKVVDTVPKKEVVLIQSTTAIKMEGKESPERKGGLRISYEDIGGLDKQIHRVRELIELPLKYPQVFERLGIEAPKGIFLHGPPGCGKTLIARAVANETDAYFTSISGPEIMGKYYGESEGRLRSIFNDAQANAPAIIFLDEIESIAPKREEMGAEKQVERRVVAQLLALMDGLQSRGQIVVIGATNIPNTVDPALRRPGRFDRELSIPIPDKNGRYEIIQIHTRGMPLAEDVDLEKLAAITHGFVGADLEALAREAAMSALRKIFPRVDFELAEIPYEILLELQVTMDNFMEALKEIEPSAIREVFIEVPDVGWDDVGGLEDIKSRLMETIEWPLKYPELFARSKTTPPKGILLRGTPGTGKTLVAKAVANESEVNFISVKGPALMSKYVGESERGIREVFKKAKQAAPTIIFFDEIDALIPIRGGGDAAHTAERVISQFLTEMDGIEELKGVVVIGATNRADMLDPAILRPGRFDLILEFPVPDRAARLEIFKIHMEGKPLAKGVDLAALAGKTDRYTGADIAAVVKRASMMAIREFLTKVKGQPDEKSIKTFTIKRKHFEEAILEAKTRIPEL
ncbi:MAG: CDC48 family AAA ATPase [Candidatus Euphemobacter frigidus]|nr:CDC48 family AAA ATPase [Candidatus Euphemobacter frigidus]MDP8274796.1 CDC48 family AAA ATPase [Candidatus Euphemobacter frigidus]